MSEQLFPTELRIRSDEALRKAVLAAAKREHTTASEWARRILRRALTGNDRDPDPPAAISFRPAA